MHLNLPNTPDPSVIANRVAKYIESPDIWNDEDSPYDLLQKTADNSELQRKILEEQVQPLKEIANSAKSQAVSAGEQAQSANIIARAAEKTANKADIKGWIAIIVSVIGVAIEIICNYTKIIEFLSGLF